MEATEQTIEAEARIVDHIRAFEGRHDRRPERIHLSWDLFGCLVSSSRIGNENVTWGPSFEVVGTFTFDGIDLHPLEVDESIIFSPLPA